MAKNDRAARGKEVAQKLFGGLPEPTPMMADMMGLTSDYLFGEVWSRPGLPIKERSRITCAVLAAMGKDTQLRTHIKGALNVGLKVEELKESFIHIAHYAGWPAGMTALNILQEVVAERQAARKKAAKKAEGASAKKAAPAKKAGA